MLLNVALPPLREELGLHPGPALHDGQPSWTLEDPVRNQFYRIDWLTFEILKQWSLGNPADIALAVQTATTLHPGEDDVLAVLKFLSDNQLLQPDPLRSSAAMAARHRQMRGSWYTQLLHHYLFFRIPLVKPDRWLNDIAPAFNWVFSTSFMRLTLLALIVGGVQVFREWEQFSSTLMDTFTPGGLLSYGIALAGVKCAHELGHALAAKRYGCRVPSMGLAFLVLWPVPYTDTNDVWKLNDKRRRLHVAGAGVLTELVVAIWATLAWTLLPDGLLRSIMFPLAATTWLATLAINTSPFMRFDGYFLLSDWLDLPNLHSRAFALARWDVRERLFRLGAPPPEYFPRRRHVGLILFAWGTWIYRLTLFLGIAVLVYHFFIKIVGIFLFGVEIVWFVLRPFMNEFLAWRSFWPALKNNRHARRSALALTLLLSLVFLPLPTRLQATGMLHPLEVLPIHAPVHAQVAALPIAEGAAVKAGDVLVQLSMPENEARRQTLQAQIERLRLQSGAAGFDDEQRSRSMVLKEELATAEAELAALEKDAARYRPVAPFAGRLYDLEPDLTPGTWVGKDEKLAVLVGNGAREIGTFLDEEEVHRVAVGDTAHFYPDGVIGPAIKATVTRIDRDGTRTLPASLWTTLQGGSIAAREKQGAWIPDHAVYHVSLSPEDIPEDYAGHVWRGKVVIAGTWEAPGMRFVRTFLSVLWREAGF